MNSTFTYYYILIFTINLFFPFSKAYSFDKKPYVISYDKKEYHAGRQNWDVKIDKYGIVYFGNTDGLLYNDCGEWGLAQMPSKEVVRSLHIDNDTIWAGGNEYGYFTRNDEGYSFTSLGVLDYQQIWNIEVVDDVVMFQTEDKILLYHKIAKSTKIITYYEGISASVLWNNKIWVLLRDGRIGYISKNKFVEHQAFNEISNKQVRKLIVHNNDLYIPLHNGKIYTYNGKQLNKLSLAPTLTKNAFLTALSYDPQTLALGTISKGFFRINNSGNIINSVNQYDDLLDNTILSMEKDQLGNIWLGLDYGIAKIEMQNAISTLFKGAATYSTANYENNTFLGTNKGLFKSTENGKYELQQEIKGQVWNTKVINSELFICHNSGMTRLNSKGYEKIITHTGVYDIAYFKNTDFYLISTYDGIHLYAKDLGQFWYVSQPDVYGFARLFYDEKNNCIWGEIKDKDILKVTLKEGGTVSAQFQKGIKRIFKAQNKFAFWDNDQFLKYSKNKFIPLSQPLLNTIEKGDIPALVINQKGNLISYIQNDQLHLKELLSDGNLHSYDALLKPLNEDTNTDFEYLDINNHHLRIATDHGLILFDVKYQSDFKKDNQPIISSVNITNENKKWIYPYLNDLIFSKGEKDMTFNFYIEKLSSDIVDFRYKLLPLDNEWSEWSTTKNSLTKQQLEGGEYTLVLQSRVNEGKIKETQLSFSIDQYWYETPLIFIPIAFISFLLIISFTTVSRYIHFKKMNVQKHQLEQENAQEILAVKEEQLLKYMEIINHKDNFLIKVKGGLDKMRNTEAKKWSLLIEDEINNEKKDLLFHKLFSEIQQDFIQSITAKYPSLTANDIRILSFIRINLSSKEISDLMNINPRSLDTSRYRLRKKLNLEQGVDLHKFVREF